jgi:bacillithiol synthase
METACIRHTDLSGTSRLFSDFSYHFDRVAKFYRHNPHHPDSLGSAFQEIHYPEDRRAALVRALLAQNGPSDSLTRLAQPGTTVVVTGQQVGLFGGPAYTIYKAVTAVKLAQDFTARGIPTVPIFWLASEDHDFPEVSNVYTFDAAQHPIRLHVDAAHSGSQPVGGIRLEHPPLDELRKSLAGFPYADGVMNAVEQSYRPGATMTEGFRALLQSLLGHMGLITLDPLDPALRAIWAPKVAEALSAAPELKAKLLERNRELSAAGYHAQVHLEPKTSLFFLLEKGQRVPQRLKDSEFGSLCDRAADVSPNALLRPVLQDYLLPTIAYIGGPAELAYFAQSSVIYQQLLGRMPIVMARSAFTLLDARAQKLLDRYKLSVTDVLVHEEALKDRLAHALVPENLERSLVDAGGQIDRSLSHLTEELERFDPTLAASLQKSRAKMLYQVEKMRRKTGREILRRDTRASADAQYLNGLLYPHRHLQERFYSILPFLAKHGMDVVDRLHDAVELSCPDHRVLTLS